MPHIIVLCVLVISAIVLNFIMAYMEKRQSKKDTKPDKEEVEYESSWRAMTSANDDSVMYFKCESCGYVILPENIYTCNNQGIWKCPNCGKHMKPPMDK